MSKPPKQTGKEVPVVIKHPVKPPDSESVQDVNSSDGDPTWDPESDRKTKQAGKGPTLVIKHPVKPPDSESVQDVSSSDGDPTWDPESDRKTKQAGKGVPIVIKHPVKPPDSESVQDVSSSDGDPTRDPESDRTTKQAGKGPTLVIKHPVTPPDSESVQDVSSSDGDPTWDPESDRKTKQGRKRVPIVSKHPVKPPDSKSEEHLSSRDGDSSPSWNPESDRKTDVSLSPETIEVEEQVPAIQQQAVEESSPIKFPPPRRETRSSAKLRELEEGAVLALVFGPEPKGAQLQKPNTFQELVNSSKSRGMRKQLSDSPKVRSKNCRSKRLVKELEYQQDLEVAEILLSLRLSGDRATSADEDKIGSPPATNLDQHPGDIPPATDQDSDDVTLAASPDHQPRDVPPATSPDQYRKVIPRPTDDPQPGEISPATDEDSDDVTPSAPGVLPPRASASPDQLGANIPPATQEYVGGNSPATDLHASNTPATDQDFEDATPPESLDHHTGDSPLATNPYQQHFGGNPPATDQDFEDVTPPASPGHHSGGVPPVTNPYQHLGDSPPATGLRPWDSPATVEGFEDVTPPASPDHQSGNNSLVTHHGHGNTPPAASQDQLERDISLATSSDQHKGDTPPPPSPGAPIQSNSQVGNRVMGAIQSVFSPDAEAASHGRSPNPVPAPEPTEEDITRWHMMFKRQKSLRVLEPEPDAAKKHKPSGGA